MRRRRFADAKSLLDLLARHPLYAQLSELERALNDINYGRTVVQLGNLIQAAQLWDRCLGLEGMGHALELLVARAVGQYLEELGPSESVPEALLGVISRLPPDGQLAQCNANSVGATLNALRFGKEK